MYSDSGIASSSSSVRSRPALVFQALASFGSALCACRGVSVSCLFICRVGGRGGANRSANREVGGGRGACTGATKYLGVPRPGLRGTKPFGMARGAPGASVGTGTATLATRGCGRAGRLGRGGSALPLAARASAPAGSCATMAWLRGERAARPASSPCRRRARLRRAPRLAVGRRRSWRAFLATGFFSRPVFGLALAPPSSWRPAALALLATVGLLAARLSSRPGGAAVAGLRRSSLLSS